MPDLYVIAWSREDREQEALLRSPRGRVGTLAPKRELELLTLAISVMRKLDPHARQSYVTESAYRSRKTMQSSNPPSFL
jgi:hypothetical protein